MRIGSAVLRVACGVAGTYAGWRMFGRSVSLDHPWVSWWTPLDFVIGIIGWGLMTSGLSLIWNGLTRIPLPGRPEGFRPELLAAKEAEWKQKNADLLEPGDHEVVLAIPGKQWMDVVKVIRDVTRLDVTDAKGLIDPIGQAVVRSRSEAAAALISDRLREAGATAVIRQMTD